MYNLSDIKTISPDKFDNLYFIYGKEKYLINVYTKKIVERLLLSGRNDFNYKKFNPLEFNIKDLEDSIQTFPFTSPVKCVVISDLGIESLKADEIKELYRVLTDIPKFASVIISETSVDVNIKKSSKWKKLVSLVQKCGKVIEVNELSPVNLEKHIVSVAERRGCKISHMNAAKIIKDVGMSLFKINSEMEKLCAFAAGREITSDIIETLTTKSFEATVFELSADIVSKNYKAAIKKLDILFYKKEEPIAILAVIASSYIDMYRVKMAKLSNKGNDDIIKLFNYRNKEFRIKNAQRQSVNLSVKSLGKILELLLETDALLKSSKVDSKTIMEVMISKLILIN